MVTLEEDATRSGGMEWGHRRHMRLLLGETIDVCFGGAAFVGARDNENAIRMNVIDDGVEKVRQRFRARFAVNCGAPSGNRR